MNRNHWILEGHEPKTVDLMTWAKWFETSERHIAQDNIGDVRVSTVFLGIDHNWRPDGPPILFETVIFGGPNSQFQERYSTWKEAEEGHKRALELVKGTP